MEMLVKRPPAFSAIGEQSYVLLEVPHMKCVRNVNKLILEHVTKAWYMMRSHSFS